jgi:hypothetical protein
MPAAFLSYAEQQLRFIVFMVASFVIAAVAADHILTGGDHFWDVVKFLAQ